MADRLDGVPDEDVRTVLRVFADTGVPVDMYTVINAIQGHRPAGTRVDGRTRAGKVFFSRRMALMTAVFAAFERGYLVMGERLANSTTVSPAGLRYLGRPA